METTKRCTKCSEVKLLECFPIREKGSEYRRPSCKLCHNADRRAYMNAYSGEYRRKNKDRVQQQNKVRNLRIAARLSDGYVRMQLAQRLGVTAAEVPACLVATKRQQLALWRIGKQIKVHLKENA